MARIGILIYTDKVKDRQIAKDAAFDDIKYFGFRRIIEDAKQAGHTIEYVSSSTMNNCDYTLASITSYYDAYNLLNELQGINTKTKIIIGGAGLSNPIPWYDKIYAACFGRGENKIGKIINGENLNCVAYPTNDIQLNSQYEIAQLEDFIRIDNEVTDEAPKNFQNFQEQSIGCPKKCFFCQYTWKNNLQKSEAVQGYKSGFNDCENTIAELDWSQKAPYFVTAIDGLTEKSREIVNRGNITRNAVKNSLFNFYEQSVQDTASLKLYCVVGYPFEGEQDIHTHELQSICEEVDKAINSKKKLNIYLQCTHFVPMPFTPMEGEAVNLVDARNILKAEMKKYEGNNISLTVLPSITSPVAALEQTILNRCKFEDVEDLRILTSKKYSKLKAYEKIDTIQRFFRHRLYCYLGDEPIHDFIQPAMGNDKMKQVKNAYLRKAYK